MFHNHDLLCAVTPLHLREAIDAVCLERNIALSANQINDLISVASGYHGPKLISQALDDSPDDVKSSLHKCFNESSSPLMGRPDWHRLHNLIAWLKTPQGQMFLKILVALLFLFIGL